ncbi:MAG: hypothetical protein JO055_06825 [Alphaproteobacteria bacterium]|nr:hypothetical protein [Alphaproteobacteria bacterium]
MEAAIPLEAPGLAVKWIDRLIHSPVGDLIARPWVDPVGLAALKRWYFPLSRLWAAANVADGSPEVFAAAIGGTRPDYGRWSMRYLEGSLKRHAAARERAVAARALWEQAAFGDAPITPEALAALDDDRRRRASLHLGTRALFYPLRFAAHPPLARWQVPSPDAVEAIYGAVRDAPAAAYAAPDPLPEVTLSHPATSAGLRERWLRFKSPQPRLASMPGTDIVYARIVEPSADAHVPTLIVGSGLCLETDLLSRSVDAANLIARMGFRVVDVVSPFHGLRCPPDVYGGEPFFATAPLGTIDLILGQTLETAVLIQWCREQFGGPVAVAGISLTSFVAQQVAVRAVDWPQAMRPDAVVLISHSGRIEEVTFNGTLVRTLGLNAELDAAGWTREALMRWEAMLNPKGAPALPPERIISVLGSGDTLLPFATGLELARAWKLPAENVFELSVGHLTMPVALMRDDRAFARLRRILATPPASST